VSWNGFGDVAFAKLAKSLRTNSPPLDPHWSFSFPNLDSFLAAGLRVLKCDGNLVDVNGYSALLQVHHSLSAFPVLKCG